MLADIKVHELKDMSYDELVELVQAEQIDVGNSSSKSGIITKIQFALREAGIIPVEPSPEPKKPKNDNPNDMNAVSNTMLEMCRKSRKVKIQCPSIYAPIFGKTYTFLLNCVPVTVKFDGTEQEFPEPIANRILEKMNEVANSNAVREEVYDELY